MPKSRVVFATYCESPEALENACRLAESIRTFGGKYRDSEIRVYTPNRVIIENSDVFKSLESLEIERHTSYYPENVPELFYAGKPFAAAQAEIDTSKDTDVLVWLDDDAVVLDEPAELDFDPDINLVYKPVMHNRAGSLYDDPPDEFWARIYEIIGLNDRLLFPMITPADKQKIRAYFHCGLLALRPEPGILQKWAQDFETLYHDPIIVEMYGKNRDRQVFLHQHALTGAILHNLKKESMRELSERYNYPILFDKQYGAIQPFNSIEKAVIIRCIVSLGQIGPDWHRSLIGPSDKIEWLREHL
jgi:hypothetical protein